MTAPAKAQIHDIGYKRYLGTRRPQHTRFRVIAKTAARMSWQGFWRAKIWVILSALVLVIIGAIMQATQSDIAEGFLSEGVAVTWADTLVPLSFSYLSIIGFALSISVASGTVAADIRAGAFEVYFSRPVRPVDYALGKILGAVIIIAPALFVAPFLLSIWRLALVGDTAGVLHALPICAKTAAAGIIYTLAYAVVPMGFSALASRPLYTILIWVAYEFMIGGIFAAVGALSGVSAIGALDLGTSLNAITFEIFGQTIDFSSGNTGPMGAFRPPPLWAAVIGLAGMLAASVALVIWRVRRAQKAGLGGG